MKATWPTKKLEEICENLKIKMQKARLKSTIEKVFKKQNINSDIKIPIVNRDTQLIKRLIIVVMIGFDEVLGKKGKLYFRLLCRLVDKSFDEYLIARKYILEEMKTKDRLACRFIIINHLENCINAINRAIKAFNSSIEADESYIKNFVSENTIRKIKELNISSIRNRMEHIDEDILENKFETGLFLDVNKNYSQICINNKCLAFVDLASIIENYHNFALEIFNNLPNRCENGVYYYDKK